MNHATKGADHAAARPSPVDIRKQLRCILDSDRFEATERRRNFLEYIVEEMLAGRGEKLKGVAIAISVFGRDESFDQQIDPVVRLEAHRLRRDLDGYYATAGRDDAVRISIPKGGYAPAFEWLQGAQLRRLNGLLPSDGPRLAAAQPPPPSIVRSRRYWIGGGVLALIVTVAVTWQISQLIGAWPSASLTTEDPVLAMPKGPKIAVLPFLNLSGDPGKQHFADGITEQLITELARYSDLFVMSRGATLEYKSVLADPREIQRKLGTDYFLEGSVRTSNETVKIVARLIDARDGRNVWVGAYENVLTSGNIFAIQETISREVAGTIAGTYGVLARRAMVEATRKSPDSLDPYDCVLRYYDYEISIDASRHESERACLERAVVLEPDYAEAWAVLANIYHQEKQFGFNPRPLQYDSDVKARDTANRAVALDPSNATTHLILALVEFAHGDIEAFKASSERAVRLNPSNPDLLAHYGSRLAFIGEWDRGLALVDKAMALNLAHPGWYYFPRALYHYDRGEYEKALAQSDEIDMPNFFWSHLVRTMILGQLGRREDAHVEAEKLFALKPDFREQAWSLMRIWQFPEPLLLHFAEGLRKAGVDIGPPPPSR